MISITQYLENPCGQSSIPYWKLASIKIPNNLKIIHEQDYKYSEDYIKVTRYFRLIHHLQNIKNIEIPNDFAFVLVNIGDSNDLISVVDIINNSYEDIKVTYEQVVKWTKHKVFYNDLWLFIQDLSLNKNIALGIAEFDQDCNEGVLEWIQVLPAYRRKGFGKALVNQLLMNMKKYAKFVTVSGQVDNPTNPEWLYRYCGFKGNDRWCVILKNGD